MLKNQWYAILESTEAKKKPVGVYRLGEKLVIYRKEKGDPVCLSDICCHRGASLAGGKLLNGKIKCPFHGLEFNTDGHCTLIPANGKTTIVPETIKVKSYPCRDIHGFIFIYYADSIPEDLPEPHFFTDLDEGMSHITEKEHWQTHYTRAMENQLDVAHLPFVHYNTIGKGNKTLVDGPGIEWVSDYQMNVYIYNRKEDGTPHRNPNEVPVPDLSKENKLELIMPNLWQNYISKKMRIIGVFAPIDDENCMLYFRIYQDIIRIPLLCYLFNLINKRYAHMIAFQDKRVVETQLPKKPELLGEHLIMADKPIIEFRKKRKELLEENSNKKVE